MKYLIPVTAIATALLVGCSESPESSAGEAKTVEIHATDNMKFDLSEIRVAPGQKIQVTLKNIGTMPKESMGHNFVVLTKGADMNAFLMAAATQARNDYVPTEFAAKVIAHTKLLGPGESDTITFKAPSEAGNYDFLCSFPGHALAGMKGLLIVE